ncbi:MAG: hypothetical protein AAGG69_13670 [Pseudomonadota bacterium]
MRLSKKQLSVLSVGFVFWPWYLILAQIVTVVLATIAGCEISAAGPQPCRALGVDFGEFFYPMWSIGYQIPLSLGWVIPAYIVRMVILDVIAYRRDRAKRDGST